MKRVYLLIILITACTGCTAQHRNPTMEILFYGEDVTEPVALDVNPIMILPAEASFTFPSPATPGDEIAYTRPFANDQRNSRLPSTLPEGLWSVANTMELNGDSQAMFVFRSGGQILVQQEEMWHLFDRTGMSIAQGPREEGDITLDPAHNRFYTNDHTGYMTAWDLETGDFVFLLDTKYGEGYDRSVWRIKGEQLSLVGTELEVMSHNDYRPPEYTIMELHSVDEALVTDEYGVLQSGRVMETLITRPVPMLTAADEDLVLVTRDHILRVNKSLEPVQIQKGLFTPLSVSLDESGNTYMIVSVSDDEGDEGWMLWGVSSDGQQFLNVKIPERSLQNIVPPIVGYDHTVFVLLDDEVMSIDPLEGEKWRVQFPVRVAGAVILADGQLLVTAGSHVWAIDAAGERRLVFESPDEILTTPAVIVSPTRMYVASSSTLFHLTPTP